MAEALRAAHARGVFHRGLRPACVLLRQPPGGRTTGAWEIRLIDFGLPPPATAAPAFTPPEQQEGEPDGPADDLYGWARTCCFALFGTPVPRPEHWRSLPEPLADLLKECLAEDPADRPADFDAVLERLARVREGRAPGRAPRLVVLRGRRRDAEYPLREGANVMGRAGAERPPDVDLTEQLAPGATGVSPRHALVLCRGGRLSITDLHSAAGTQVNRTRLNPGEEHPLSDQDVIEVGGVLLQVSVGG
jgi:hypothetical protein